MKELYVPDFRHERKFLLPAPRAAALRARLSAVMRPDPHAGPGGLYHIRSLYFDDALDTCFQESESGADPREKYRIRCYDNDPSTIHLECKRKERGMTQKVYCRLPEEQALLLAAGTPPDDLGSQPPVLRALALAMRTRGMRPAVIVDYDRIPYVFPGGNVRITFDTNIASAPAGYGLCDPDVPRRPVLPAGTMLLEVKYDAFLPDHIMDLLHTADLRQTAFSKYYLCRKYALSR